MKKCLQCEQVYGDETNFCLSDGAALVSVSGSFNAPSETPTVFNRAPSPTMQSNTPFIPTVSSAAPETPPGRTLLIALTVGFFALLIGGAVVGLIMYGIFKSNGANVANSSNSADKTNKPAFDGQKSGNDNAAQNLKQQQEKLDREKQKLEDERKALEAKKKQASPTPRTSSATTAVIIDPPTNIRATPNGTIICVMRQRGTVVNILGSTNVRDNNGTWYYTDACGRQGVIHSSQIRF